VNFSFTNELEKKWPGELALHAPKKTCEKGHSINHVWKNSGEKESGSRHFREEPKAQWKGEGVGGWRRGRG